MRKEFVKTPVFSPFLLRAKHQSSSCRKTKKTRTKRSLVKTTATIARVVGGRKRRRKERRRDVKKKTEDRGNFWMR